jgi:hypothetical protein
MPRALSPLLLLPVLLTGCGTVTPMIGAELVGAVTVGSVAAIGRTPVDAAYSLITGKDCSLVRLDEGKTYCRPIEPLPDAPPYCTRSLGVVDCWQDPAAVPNLGPDVADGPRALTPAQEANRTRTWP